MRTAIIACALSLAVFGGEARAEEVATERLILQPQASIEAKKREPARHGEMYADASFEGSGILQGSRTGRWAEAVQTFGYQRGQVNAYLSLSELERFDERDYTFNAGGYFNFKDSYAHLEGGYGSDVDYIYRLQSIVEYGHRFAKDLFWQAGYIYREYDTGDTHLVNPQLIYYFGDHYISAGYGISFIESRDTAHFGMARGDFAITRFLRWSLGAAYGERLYDIYGLDAREELGYIAFTGITVVLPKDFRFRAGYSYSVEDPKFIKRSVSFGLSARF